MCPSLWFSSTVFFYSTVKNPCRTKRTSHWIGGLFPYQEVKIVKSLWVGFFLCCRLYNTFRNRLKQNKQLLHHCNITHLKYYWGNFIQYYFKKLHEWLNLSVHPHATVPAHQFIDESLENNADKYLSYDMQKKDSSLFLSVIHCCLQAFKWLISSENQWVYHEVMFA